MFFSFSVITLYLCLPFCLSIFLSLLVTLCLSLCQLEEVRICYSDKQPPNSVTWNNKGFFFFFFGPETCRILVPQPGIEPRHLAVKARSPNPWTTREFPTKDYFLSYFTLIVGQWWVRRPCSMLFSLSLCFSSYSPPWLSTIGKRTWRVTRWL